MAATGRPLVSIKALEGDMATDSSGVPMPHVFLAIPKEKLLPRPPHAPSPDNPASHARPRPPSPLPISLAWTPRPCCCLHPRPSRRPTGFDVLGIEQSQKLVREDDTEWKWSCFKPWETYTANTSIDLTKHHKPKTMVDKIAYYTVKSLHFPTNIFFQVWLPCNDAGDRRCGARDGGRHPSPPAFHPALRAAGGSARCWRRPRMSACT